MTSSETEPSLGPADAQRPSPLPALLLAAAAGLAVLGAGAGFAKSALQYLDVTPIVKAFRPVSAFKIRAGALQDYSPRIVWSAAIAALALGLVAVVACVMDVLPSQKERMPASSPRVSERDARWLAALIASLAFVVTSFLAHQVLERERTWAEWAAISTVALGAVFGALRARAVQAPPRLPKWLLPLVITLAAFLIGVSDSAQRWYDLGSFLEFDLVTQQLSAEAAGRAVQYRPVGSVVLLDAALVLLVFGVWAWARPGAKGPRNHAPLALALVAFPVVLGYVGLNRRIRQDFAEYTGGTGSNEDLLFYARFHPVRTIPSPDTTATSTPLPPEWIP